MSASASRVAAAQVVGRVRERAAYAHEVLATVVGRAGLTAEDAAFATRLAYGTLQTEGTLDEALGRYLAGKKVEPRVRDALRLAAYELIFMKTPSRAAVHQGVELVRSARPQAAGLANAVLRRLADDVPEFPWGDPATDTAALARLYGHPLWLAEMWVRELGRDAAEQVMCADNEPAPLYLAINPFGAGVEEARRALRADGAQLRACPVEGCLEAADPGAAVRGNALKDGMAVACDAGAQLVSRFVPVTPGAQVVEIGAGRGTKTLLLQARAVESGGPAHISAIDLHEFKVRLLKERMDLLGVPDVSAVVADATDLDGVEGVPAAGGADAVLVDAPCSGLGTLRRHPEKRWRVTTGDVDALAELGSRLLEGAARLVRPGGFVVYSTCTIARRENEDVITSFLGGELGSLFDVDPLAGEVPGEWSRFATEEGYFRSLPSPGGPDGHFAARLKRR